MVSNQSHTGDFYGLFLSTMVYIWSFLAPYRYVCHVMRDNRHIKQFDSYREHYDL